MSLNPANFVAKSAMLTARDNTTDVTFTTARDCFALCDKAIAVVPALTAAAAIGKFITVLPITAKHGVVAVSITCSAGGTSATGNLVAVDANGTELGDITGSLNLAAAATVTSSLQTNAVPYVPIPVGTSYLALKLAGAEFPIGFKFTAVLDVVKH